MKTTSVHTLLQGQAGAVQDQSDRTSKGGTASKAILSSRRQVAQAQQVAQLQPGQRTHGLPHALRTGIESLSGMDMSSVRVHRNSSEPAQLNALAYAQGTDIHLAPGQERHLPHEAWHVVQQRQGRVRATQQMAGLAVNDDADLEREADQMGARALALGRSGGVPMQRLAVRQASRSTPEGLPLTQRKVGFEFETGIPVRQSSVFGIQPMPYQAPVFSSNTGNWKVVADSSNMEFVTEPFDENPGGRLLLANTMAEISNWAANIPGVVTAANNAGNPGTGRVSAIDPAVGTAADAGWRITSIVMPIAALSDAEILCAPQATGGFRLEQIPALVDAMATTQITAAKPQALGHGLQQIANLSNIAIVSAAANGVITNAQRDEWLTLKGRMQGYQLLTGVAPQQFASSLVAMNLDHARWLVEAKNAAVLAVNNHIATLPLPAPNFDQLKGLLTLVISYLMVGANEPQQMPYAKVIAPLMARTNFYTMFRQLTPVEQALFNSNDFILAAANMPGSGGTQLFAAGFSHGAKTEHGPTRGAWIDSIANGSPGALFGTLWRSSTDLMSQGSGSTAAANSSSLGSMNQLDRRVTGQQDLAVLELRRLPKQVQRAEWPQMALDIFDMIVNLP